MSIRPCLYLNLLQRTIIPISPKLPIIMLKVPGSGTADKTTRVPFPEFSKTLRINV